MLNFFKNKKVKCDKSHLNESIEEFSIWAKHTGNYDWIGFAKMRLKLIERESENTRPDRFVEELLKLQSVIRKLNNL